MYPKVENSLQHLKVPGFGEGKQTNKKPQLSRTFECITDMTRCTLMKFIILVSKTLLVTMCAIFYFSLANKK